MFNSQPLTSTIALCLETICVRNRQLQNLWAHNERYNRTRQALWQKTDALRLENQVVVPGWLLPDRIYKCRVTYGPTIENVEFEEYHVRPVHRLMLVEADGLDYRYKYANRQPINDLVAQRGSADDVLMVRNGLLTDTSYANIALFDGRRWYTPAQPLLEGTQRARLLREGVLHPIDIRPAELQNYTSVRLINAMLGWEQAINLPVEAIISR